VTSSEGSSARRGVVHTHTNKRFNSDHRGPFRGIVTTPLALGERLLAFTLSRLYPEPPGRFGGQYGIRETLPSMTPEEFRRIALSLPEAQEVYRRGRSHFRVERKAFATLEGPGDAVATVNLTPDQQSMFMHEAPKAFVPVPGGWGRLGSTSVLLASLLVPCPLCVQRMVITAIEPALLASGARSKDHEDVTHGCEQCGTTIVRTIPSLSCVA
jgi:hypothetical protein